MESEQPTCLACVVCGDLYEDFALHDAHLRKLCGLPIRFEEFRWVHVSAGAEASPHAALPKPLRNRKTFRSRFGSPGEWLFGDVPLTWDEFPKRLLRAALLATVGVVVLSAFDLASLLVTWFTVFIIRSGFDLVRTAMADHDAERAAHRSPREDHRG